MINLISNIALKCLLIKLVISTSILYAQIPKPSADLKENNKLIREMLAAGKMDNAILFVDECLKLESDREFYLGFKLELLYISKRTEKAIECALLLDNTSAVKTVNTAMRLAELYLDKGNDDNTFLWMNKAAERGLKDLRLVGNHKWDSLKKDARYEKIRNRILDNQGIGKPVKDFNVKLVNGNDFQISQLKGKVVLIDFWATWCSPCVAHIPDLKKYYNKYHNNGFEIVGISLDTEINSLTKYIAEKEIEWYVSFSGKEWGQDMTANLLGVDMIPTTFLVDKAGNLRHYNIQITDLEQAIQNLLSE